MLHIPGLDNMMIYITYEHQPIHGELAAKFAVPNLTVVGDNNALPVYYSACVAMLRTAIGSHQRPKRMR